MRGFYMSKQTPREEIEQRIDAIRYFYRVAMNESSKDPVINGLIADIGILLNEVDYWRSEATRLQNTQEIHNTQNDQHAIYRTISIDEEELLYGCPDCETGFEDENQQGISWEIVLHTISNQGISVDIGYIHCSECGVDSPLFAGKETACRNWCIDLK